LRKLCVPQGIIVDQLSQIYVAELDNDWMIRWCKETAERMILIGGNE
jgi:hypothetical protein